ncbi:uncharacterized protein TNCV_3727861 [Trichonephila clavipes]|uniref:Uncharacterized protein n=1 Tax=Trichonephila clavipes TaxID=2585209 RepID=A0A8X6RBD1_TRICX|nr:uncharacterized protein TNCV_3727861 [Trichonephila clavipes]
MFKLKHPSCLLCVGASQCGKTTLIRDMIAQKAYDYEFKNIIWSYKAFQDNFISEKGIKFVEGLPEKFESDCLYIFDDFLHSLNEKVSQLFTITAHHSRISVILILQNLFPRNKVMRDISLNAQYIILFKNNRDVGQIQCFARQLYGNKAASFMDAYKKSTQGYFNYLLVDLHPRTDEKYRLRESVFPDSNGIHWIYVPIK